MNEYQASVKTPFAHLGLRLEDDQLVGVEFIDRKDEISPSTKTAKSLCAYLKRYCQAPGDVASVKFPCKLNGTPFQQKVWRALRDIPAGEVMTYGELAKKVGSSARAVGNACRKNPVPVVIPCHRVVSASGPGGYAGATQGVLFDIKCWLLEHEGVLHS